MTPTARIEAITTRIHRRNRRLGRAVPVRKTVVRRPDWAYTFARAREAREAHLLEYQAWVDAIARADGCIASVARIMGYSANQSRLILWDLGLWPEVVRARGEALP